MSKYLALFVSVLLALGSTFAFAPHAGAVVLSAADLAADCNDDGVVTLTADTTYAGGSADIIGTPTTFGFNSCLVDLTVPGVDLTLVNVNLRGKGGPYFNIGQRSVGKTTVSIWNSTIDMAPTGEPAGDLSIKTGCCGGLPSEVSTTVTIVGSQLRGRSVELGASLAASNGRFFLAGTRVEATQDPFLHAAAITIRVSAPGTGGRIAAFWNTFISPGGLEARTATAGTTWVPANDFTGVVGGVTLTTGTGGSCTSVGSVPATPCV